MHNYLDLDSRKQPIFRIVVIYQFILTPDVCVQVESNNYDILYRLQIPYETIPAPATKQGREHCRPNISKIRFGGK